MSEILSLYNKELLTFGFITIRMYDILDVLIVSFTTYKIYNYIKGSISAQIVSGLLTIAFVFFVANLMNLTALKWVVSQIVGVWIMVVVVLFQPELRRILLYLGSSPFVRRILSKTLHNIIDEVIQSLIQLRELGCGALIVFTRGAGLKSYLESGTQLEAQVSIQLLKAIFQKNSPLHDGAVIINNDRIEAAKCVLPLTQNEEVTHAFGTRHRAAIGISEVTDSVALVLSEETGKISYSEDGKIATNLSFEELREKLLTSLTSTKLPFFRK